MTISNGENYRAVEDSIHTDFDQDMSYGDYLQLDQILNAQVLLSNEHDEMLFIVIHQASELWLKLAGHELSAAIQHIDKAEFGPAFKVISRVKQIVRQLTQSWDILSTLTPVDYLKFRDRLGHSSGFQSYGYRKLEFLLGNKNKASLNVHRNNEDCYRELELALNQPSLYDVVIKAMSKRGLTIDNALIERDYSLPYQSDDSVLQAWHHVYQSPALYFDLYELAEKLVDIEDAVQQWRFKHLSTVMRIIGNKAGTGGSSGVKFLKKALDVSFFPELYTVRSML